MKTKKVNPEKDRLVKGGDCRHYSDKQIPGREGQGSVNLKTAGPLRATRDTRQVITDQEITQGCYPKDSIKYIFIS